MAKARILIVEDSFIVAFHLRTTLESDGYIVSGQCDSGEQAIASIESSRPDLVLMDIMLSGKLDGIETASKIRSRFNVPVIFITALTDKDTINRAKITEPYGYLTKPFEDLQIFTVIEIALYKHDIESRLKQSEQRYFSTVNSISDCVITIDRNYCVSYMNPSAENVTGCRLHDAIGRPVGEVLALTDEATNDTGVNPLQCPLLSGRVARMPDNLFLAGRQGMEIPIGESSLSPIMDKSGDITGMIIVFKDMTDKRAHEKLMKEIKQTEMAALIEGQEKERARIAKDLHDGLGQMLNAIKMNVGFLINNKEEASHLSRLLDEAIMESVRISENLLPSKLRDFGLSVCLEAFCDQLSSNTGIDISFHLHGMESELTEAEKINFYRIAQEAVSNSIKHSGASEIYVQLTFESSYVRFSVEDNGKGTTAACAPVSRSVQPGGNGLVNMRDRAESMGGKFSVESDPRRGTLVIVEVPVKNLVLNG